MTLRLHPYLQDANATILHNGGCGWSRTSSARGGGFTVHWGYQFSYTSKICSRLHGVSLLVLGGLLRLTSVSFQLFPLTTLFLPLLDRLTLASLLSQSPRSLAWVGFRLLILLSVVLVFGAPNENRTHLRSASNPTRNTVRGIKI